MRTGQHMQLTWGLALLGQDVGTSAAVRYQFQFQLDVNNLALALTFNFLNNIGLQLSADGFQISQQRQALSLVAMLMDTLQLWKNKFQKRQKRT